jgi:gluconokinase
MEQTASRRWVVMGVCGCGKSTVGTALAQADAVAFIEGDKFHPAANVAKMSAGTPLTDDDRAEWLLALQAQIREAREKGVGLVVSCSALKRRYRDLLRQGDPELQFVHLEGPRDLEPLQPDEAGVTLDIALPPDALLARIT